MIKWKRWQQQTKKFEVKIVVRCLNGYCNIHGLDKLTVEIKWKGSRSNGFRSFGNKCLKRDFTKGEYLGENGVVLWDQVFNNVCRFSLSNSKDKEQHPWEVAFLVFTGSEKQSKKKVRLAAPAVLNLVEFASLEDANEFDINVPLSILDSGFNCSPSLCITLSVLELKIAQEDVPRQTMFAPLSPCFGGSILTNKDEGSTLKSSLRKVKSLTDYVSSRSGKKTCNGEGTSDSKFSTGSDCSESNSPFDTDSFDDCDDEESERIKEDIDVLKSCNYGTLMHANFRINCDDENLVYYSNNKEDVECSTVGDFRNEASEKVQRQSPKFGILAWRKRKLSFKAPRVKGEPLLNKDYGEEGGDDIDFDRRQLSSDESMAQFENGAMISEFGDDKFAVGSWEKKEVLSRDGIMKLVTQVFFASIDQRSETAAGESACTALVAVLADWLHCNQGIMPTKSEFDSLIREGSLQWRKLCENNTYMERFPDKHFDLETILEAKIRPLSVVSDSSIIGFFRPEGISLEEECFGFLDGAMSFDNIWDKICLEASKQEPNSEPLMYIVSWNDHFFLLRVDFDAYYIIDTLGERLYEGGNQAYVLKFDETSVISRTPLKEEKTSNGKSTIVEGSLSKEKVADGGSEIISAQEEDMVICKGRECCKDYIKSFLAAIPIRELQADMKKESRNSTLIHQRLQIEFNYTVQAVSPPVECVTPEIIADLPVPMVAMAVA